MTNKEGMSGLELNQAEIKFLDGFNLSETKLVRSTELDETRDMILKLKRLGYLENVGMLNHPTSQAWNLRRIK